MARAFGLARVRCREEHRVVERICSQILSGAREGAERIGAPLRAATREDRTHPRRMARAFGLARVRCREEHCVVERICLQILSGAREGAERIGAPLRAATRGDRTHPRRMARAFGLARVRCREEHRVVERICSQILSGAREGAERIGAPVITSSKIFLKETMCKTVITLDIDAHWGYNNGDFCLLVR